MRAITDKDWESWDRNKDAFKSIEEMILYMDRMKQEHEIHKEEVINRLRHDLYDNYPEFTVDLLKRYFDNNLIQDASHLAHSIRQNPEAHKLWILQDYKTISMIRHNNFKPPGWENYYP